MKTELHHLDGTTTIVDTNESGDTRITLEKADGSISEIGQEGSGLSHDEVVNRYKLPGDTIVEDP